MPSPVDEGRIIEAALEVWREVGFRAATTRKVAERAGVGEVTLFRRFGNKATLFAEALATEAARFGDDGVEYTGDVRRDLRAIAAAYQRMLDQNIAIVSDVLTNTLGDEEGFAKAARGPLRTMLKVSGIVAAHQREGRLAPGPPTSLLVALLSPMMMGQMLTRVHPMLPLDTDVDTVVERFLAGWRRRS